LPFSRFLWAYDMVASRCFGYSLPSDVIQMPFADYMNHDVESNLTYYTVHNKYEEDKQLATDLNYVKKKPYIYK
jgi:outer membrane lipoprotein-sorting protein